MDNLKESAEQLADHTTEYLETHLKLFTLRAAGRAAGAVSQGVSWLLTGILFFFFLLFAGVGLGWWLGEVLQNMLAGFLIVAGVYGLLAVVLLALHKKVIVPLIRNVIIRIVYE